MTDRGGSPEPSDLFDQWLAHHDGCPVEPVADVVEAEEPAVPEPVAPEKAAPDIDPAPDPTPADIEPPVARPVPEPSRSLPQTIFFKPRAGTQRILGLLLLVFLALTAAAVWWAYVERTPTFYAIAGIAAAVTAVIWATRTSSSPARLTLHGSELEIVRGGSRALFDLAHTTVEMRGKPGTRTWRVLLLRRSMSPYVIDGSMVDPREFAQVVRYFHPEL